MRPSHELASHPRDVDIQHGAVGHRSRRGDLDVAEMKNDLRCPHCQGLISADIQIHSASIVLEGKRTEDASLRAVPVQKLALRTRPHHCLQIEKIETVGQLMDMTDLELLRIPALGKISILEIRGAIEKLRQEM